MRLLSRAVEIVRFSCVRIFLLRSPIRKRCRNRARVPGRQILVDGTRRQTDTRAHTEACDLLTTACGLRPASVVVVGLRTHWLPELLGESPGFVHARTHTRTHTHAPIGGRAIDPSGPGQPAPSAGSMTSIVTSIAYARLLTLFRAPR